MRPGILAAATALLVLGWPGTMAAQELDGPFSGLVSPTPRVPPAAVGMIEMPLQSTGQETGEETAEASPLPGMALGATLGSLAGTATGVLSVVAICQDHCDYSWEAVYGLLAAGWVGGTAGSAIGVWTAGNEDGVTGGDAVLASLVGGGIGLAAADIAYLAWTFPLVQGITTGVVANLLRD